MSVDELGSKVLHLPVGLVREIASVVLSDVSDGADKIGGDAVESSMDPLLVAVMPWAVVYHSASTGELCVGGFENKDELSDAVAGLFRTAEIIAVLHDGKPVRFKMRVKAQIG